MKTPHRELGILTAALVFVLAACGEGEKTQAAASGSAKPATTTPKPVASAKTSATPATAPAVASADAADDDIPTEEDFEEEAEKEITADKWDAELALLGKEIAEDKE